MPHGFEYIVRPYQSPDSLGATVIPATPKGTRERAHLTWGGKGTMPQLRLTELDFNTKKSPHDETLTEKDRESDIVRIEQPGKPENYVDVARAKKIRLTKEGDEFYLDESALNSYVESKIDERLNSFTPSLSHEVEVGKDGMVVSRATWNMKNQQ